MGADKLGDRRTGSAVLQALLAKDLFARIRSDQELADLARDACTQSRRPYSTLLSRLLGTRLGIGEEKARSFWLEAVDHRRLLASALGRPVHLRVAAMDLLSRRRELPIGRSLLVAENVLEDVLEAASTDGLTALLRREHFVPIVAHELKRRYTLPPIVAFMDLDRFKQVNDRFGHARGDAVLAGILPLWMRCARRGDELARIGGDELAALFSESTVPQVQSVLRRFRALFVKANAELGVGISIGLVAARSDETAESLLQRADQVMYHAKKGRRRGRPAPSPRSRPTGIYSTRDPERFLAVHTQAAAWGALLYPTPRYSTLNSLAAMVAPRLLVLDEELLLLSRADLAGALRSRYPSARVVVAASGPGAPHAARREGIEQLAWPPRRRELEFTFRAAFGARVRGIPALGGASELEQLSQAVAALVEGRPVELDAQVRARPEVDLLRSLLGS